MAPFISRTHEQVRFDQLQNLPAGVKSGITRLNRVEVALGESEAVFCAMFDINMLYENCSGSVAQRLASVVAWRSARLRVFPLGEAENHKLCTIAAHVKLPRRYR